MLQWRSGRVAAMSVVGSSLLGNITVSLLGADLGEVRKERTRTCFL